MPPLIFLLEEPSAKAFLESLTERLGMRDACILLSFNGKSDLEGKLANRMRGWMDNKACFLIMRDRDSGDCFDIKERLLKLCSASGVDSARFRVRVACGELESFYLGDMNAIAQAYNKPAIQKKSRTAKYRNPDKLGNACEEFFQLIGQPPTKVSAAKRMAPFMEIEQDDYNNSASFRCLLRTLKHFRAHGSFPPQVA